jgi:AraC family transcriptional regulator, transcriptional activator of pobA
MTHLLTLDDYCRHINIPRPLSKDFDIRQFSDNMRTVKPRMEPFRHEFYAVSLVLSASGTTTTGATIFDYQNNPSTLLFNSPYQTVAWDIAPNWEGFYIIFSDDFIRKNPFGVNLLADFPFLMLDKAVPFPITGGAVPEIERLFELIFAAYHSTTDDRFEFIQGYTYLLLLTVKRCFHEFGNANLPQTQENRTADVALVNRFQQLIEMAFQPNAKITTPHQVGTYADKMRTHPNHLNAIVKRITGKTAKQVLQDYIAQQAKNLLTATPLSIKEIAYQLHFEEPTHFNSFFKKMTEQTPQQWRGK